MSAPFTVHVRWEGGIAVRDCFVGSLRIAFIVELGGGEWRAFMNENTEDFPTLDAAKAAVEEFAKKYLGGRDG